jgi:hypothetical protein
VLVCLCYQFQTSKTPATAKFVLDSTQKCLLFCSAMCQSPKSVQLGKSFQASVYFVLFLFPMVRHSIRGASTNSFHLPQLTASVLISLKLFPSFSQSLLFHLHNSFSVFFLQVLLPKIVLVSSLVSWLIYFLSLLVPGLLVFFYHGCGLVLFSLQSVRNISFQKHSFYLFLYL